MTEELHDLTGPSSHSERLKVEYAPVMQAIYRSMKRFAQPGEFAGVAEVADLIERSEKSLRNQFGPTQYDHAPTVHCFLQVIEALRSREAVAEIAALADCATIPRRPSDASDICTQASTLEAFDHLPSLAAKAAAPTVTRLEAHKTLTSTDRAAAREALHDLIAYAAHLLTRVR